MCWSWKISGVTQNDKELLNFSFFFNFFLLSYLCIMEMETKNVERWYFWVVKNHSKQSSDFIKSVSKWPKNHDSVTKFHLNSYVYVVFERVQVVWDAWKCKFYNQIVKPNKFLLKKYAAVITGRKKNFNAKTCLWVLHI